MRKFTLLLSMLMVFTFTGWGQIISQYIDTNLGTTPKGIEIWNNTASVLDFSTNNLEIWKGTNGASPSVDYTLSTGTLAVGHVIVIGTSDLQTVTENNGSTFYLKAFTFNGDDALEVYYGGTKTDVFGDPGTGDPGSGWSGNGVQTWDQNIQLLTGITTGDTDGWTDPSTRFETVCTDNCLIGFGLAPSAGGGNQAPVITNLAHTPEYPTSSDAVTISADITDDGTLTTTTLNWGTTSGALDQTASMSNGGSGDIYSATIAAQADGAIIYYEVFAEDDESETTTSPEQSYTVDDNPILFGDIIVTEIMQNPADVGDTDGEWFELFNTTTADIDIDGWTISDNGSNSHVINNGGALNVPPGGYLILGINSDGTTNGGVPVDYEYASFSLGNSDDEIILTSAEAVEIDRVEWDGGSTWPDPTGASMTYTGLASEDNNVGSKWITAVTRENNYTNPGGSETDKGSPKSNGLFQNLITTTTWTGTGNWSEGNGVGNSNWSNGSPGSAVDVTIDGTVTVDLNTTTPAVSNDLDLSTGASIILSVNNGLTVYGDLDVTLGTLTVQSDVNGNGSIIVEGTATGYATVERYMEGYDVADNGWHNIGSPVDNMLISVSDFDPTIDPNDDLYQWNETSEEWENYKQGHFTNFVNGQGYLCAIKFTDTRNFVGTLNTDNFTQSSLTKDVLGFNLLGNPYASALVWNNGDWTLDNVGEVAQIWEETNGSYTPIAANGIIPSTNGFFVEVATVAGGSVTIPASARTHDATNNYKNVVISTNQETLDLRLTNDENMYYDVCRVGFKDDATEVWDIQYDAHKLFGGTGTSQLWSVMGDENFVFNYLPYVYESYQLPIYFRAGVNATHHINAEGIESFFGNSGIYLEDLKTGDLVNLSEQQFYTFTASTEDDEARFILHFSGITSVGEDMLTDDGQIYANGNSVYFRFETMPIDDAQVSVFNTIGQQVYAGEVGQCTLSSIRLNEKPGIYIVRLQSEKGTTTQKVMIK